MRNLLGTVKAAQKIKPFVNIFKKILTNGFLYATIMSHDISQHIIS